MKNGCSLVGIHITIESLHKMISHPTFTYFRSFLHQDFYEELEKYVYSDQIKWFFRSGTLHPTDYCIEEGESQYDCYTWGCSVYNEISDDIANIHDVWKPLIQAIRDQFNSEIHRLQLNLYTNQNKKIYTKPHYDLGSIKSSLVPDEKFSTIILNFTNCNGGTQILDVEIPSFKNGAVHFSNVYLHNGILQTDKVRRISANIVTYPIEKRHS